MRGLHAIVLTISELEQLSVSLESKRMTCRLLIGLFIYLS